MRKKLANSTLETVAAGMDALAQDLSRRNVEDAIEKKDVVALAEAVAAFNLEQIREEIATGIKLNVNGKIDAMRVEIKDIKDDIRQHNTSHESDMVALRPIILAFEQGQQDLGAARRGGKGILWAAGGITALGSAYLILKQIFSQT